MAGIYKTMEGPALEALKNLIQTLESKAAKELGGNTPTVTRMLCPEDIKLDSEDSTSKYRWWFTLSSTGTTANTLINGRTIDDNRFIGIYGLTVPNTSTASQIEITRKGSLARKWNVQVAPHTLSKTVYFDDPFTCDQNTTITVSCYASSAAAAGENLIFHGVTVEKRGLTVNP